MSVENKILISDLCKKHNIHLFQAHIIRDIFDSFELPSFIYLSALDDSEKLNMVLKTLPQVFCTDTYRLSNQQVKKINHLSELPYIKGYEGVVEEFYRNLNSENKNG
jgi:hypothetical protein